MSNIYKEIEVLFNHLKNDNYEDILIFNKTILNNTSFDLIIYFHNAEMNQMGRPILFINFYDINTETVNWNILDKDWENVSTNLTWENVKAGIERINGFKYSLERSTPLGTEKPHLYYLQIVGMRDELNQFDIATMQNSFTRVDYTPFSRLVATYNFMIEKFRPIIN